MVPAPDPNVKVQPREGQETITPTLEGVQLCLENSARLYSDSTKVSEPTSAALLELGLEEHTKAWRLYFGFMAWKFADVKLLEQYMRNILNISSADIGTRISKHFEIKGAQATKPFLEFLKQHGKKLFETPFTADEFRDHNAKLGYLGLVIDYLKVTIPALHGLTDRDYLIATSFGRSLLPDLRAKAKSASLDTYMKKLKAVDTNYIRELELT